MAQDGYGLNKIRREINSKHNVDNYSKNIFGTLKVISQLSFPYTTMEVKGLRMYPTTGEGSIDLKQLPAFLSQFNSLNSGRIYFTVKETILPNGDKVQSLLLKRESAALLQ